MTRDELRSILERVEAHWPHRPVTDGTAAVWWEELHELPGSAVLAAVRSIARSGREFPPAPGHVLAEIADQTTAAPDFDQAWEQILQAIRRHGHQRALAALKHPAVLELARSIGVRDLALTQTDQLGTWHAQARERYALILRRHNRRVTHAELPSAALHELPAGPRPVSHAIRGLLDHTAPGGIA